LIFLDHALRYVIDSEYFVCAVLLFTIKII
jgi:hypothetical protein